MKRYGGWYWYTTEKMNLLEKHKCGKWMCFHYDQKFAMLVCEKAISEDVCYACKCTDMEQLKVQHVQYAFIQIVTIWKVIKKY